MKGQLEQRVLVLVTLGLVAFGLVMVFSATSAAAALGEGDPMRFLVKQGAYALVGSRPARRLCSARLPPPPPARAEPARRRARALRRSSSPSRPPINGARRWFLFGPVSFQPSELAKLALCVWVCAYLARRPAPRTLGELMKPIGLVVVLFGGADPRRSPTSARRSRSCSWSPGVLVVSGLPLRLLATARLLRARARRRRDLDRAVPARARSSPSSTRGRTRRAPATRRVQAMIGIGSGGITGNGPR